MARELTSVSQLRSELKKPIIIFCGSAVSGGINDRKGNPQTFLPMTRAVIQTLFHEISRLPSQNYFESVLHNYAAEMINGKYQFNTFNLKFEDFIWRIEKARNKNQVRKLLYSLYFCNRDQFLPNHIAISKLLKDNFSNLCVTTNFDNVIENINPKLIKIVQDEGTTLTKIPTRNTILKLHGDVAEGKYITTTPELLNAEQLDRFSYLYELFENSNILVSGYSGLGDIDISPHFREAKKYGTRFIWLIRNDSEPNEFIQDVADYYFKTNLFSSNRDENCLLDLAEIDNYFVKYPLNFPNWQSKLSEWIQENKEPYKILKIIDECLEGIVGWAKYHIYTVGGYQKYSIKKKNMNYGEDEIYLADRCLKIGTYWVGLFTLGKLDPSHIWSKRNYFQYIYIKGFCYWRLMRIADSLKVLDYFASTPQKSRILPIFENGFKTYLEVVRDQLQFLPSQQERRKFYNENEISKKIRRLKRILVRSQNNSSQILSLVAINDIRRLIGEKIPIADYNELFERAISLNDWSVAENVALSILKIDRNDGELKLLKVDANSNIGRYWHSKKARFLARHDYFPYYIKVSIRWLIAKISVLWREALLQLKKFLWHIFSFGEILVIE